MMKNQKGITLIALVITIIVLLILAGVSIAMLSGDNGILNQAARAGSNTKVKEAKEQADLKVDEIIGDYYEEKYTNSDFDDKTISDYVKSKLVSVEGLYYVGKTKIVIEPKYKDGTGVIGTIGTSGSIDWSDPVPAASMTTD